MAEALRLHHFLPASRANGPGMRAVVWVQGCTLGCRACFNPQTHSQTGGSLVNTDELFEKIRLLGDAVEGVTLSGGEPFQQISPVSHLLKRIRTETCLSTIVFTGFTPDEIGQFPKVDELKRYIDVLIAGRYDANRPVERGLITSANQMPLILTDRYTVDDLLTIPPIEMILDPDGEILITGVGGVVF
jgi:anaerobic ribonucleoside-triphosphate reductase activating protein